MSVSLYFGLPGCGKTTMMTAIAYKHLVSHKYKSPYKYVYGNVPLSIPGYIYIDNDCIGKYDLSNCLILIDEATLFADSRDYKNIKKDVVEYFLEHRHFRADIILFTQQWDGVDRKIRVITDRVYYMYKPKFLGQWFSCCYRIPYGIIIPDPKKSDTEKLGEIIQGYCKPHIFVRLFSPKLFRPKYYKYFDSFETPHRDPLPEKYKAYKVDKKANQQ